MVIEISNKILKSNDFISIEIDDVILKNRITYGFTTV